MAGSVPGFDADAVRAGLRLAMTVGLSPKEEEQPTFFFARTATTDAPADEDAVPFDVTKKRVLGPPQSVKVTCAVEYHDNQGKIENFGLIVPSKVVLTLLDEEYEQVKGFQYVVIGGNRYWYKTTEAPVGLVSVGVYTIHCTAEDAT